MELAFGTRTLRSNCEDAERAALMWGLDVAERLKDRVADLRAAGSVRDLIAGSPTLSPGTPPTATLELAAGYRLVCEVNHAAIPSNEHGEVDWERVRRLKLTRVERTTNV